MADKQATLAINQLHCALSDAVWVFFSNRYVWIPLYLAVIFMFFKKLGWRRALLSILACVLTVAACDQLGNLVKDSVMRLRPCWDGYMLQHGLHLLEGEGNLFGFYSAHAANAMGFALCSVACFEMNGTKGKGFAAYSILIFAWALMVGLSRVFVGKHFLGDVMAGFLVGAVIGVLFAFAQKLIVIHRVPAPISAKNTYRTSASRSYQRRRRSL